MQCFPTLFHPSSLCLPCSVISDHLIQFLIEPSSFMHSSSNCQEHCNNPDPNVFMEHFLKIVHTLLDGHAPLKSINKKPNIYSSKPWTTTCIAKSIKVKDNLYKNDFKWNKFIKQSAKNNLGPIRTIFPLSLDDQRTRITMYFLKKKKKC